MAFSSAYENRCTCALCFLMLVALSRPTAASHFLPRPQERAPGSEVDPGFGNALATEIEATLGREHRSFTEKRIEQIVEAVRPTYAAVSKNEHGYLSHAAASYVLHRLFVQRHAWSVIGLDPAGESIVGFNNASATQILENRVPEHVLYLFEQRLRGRGLGLRELAVLAATLEHLVHKEAIMRLQVAFQSHDFSTEDVLSDTEADLVMDSYMAYYLLGTLTGNISRITPEKVRRARDMVDDVYPTWTGTQKFIRDVKERIAPNRDHMYFADIAAVVEEIGLLYGRWQDSECRAIKDMLMAFEDRGPLGAGRVRLAEFYRKVLHEDAWQLGESLNSLRQMGAIDDTDPTNLRVIIPNFVYSPANCVAGSSYYSVCCVDECDGLVADMEAKFVRPDLSAQEIATHVAAMPSATMTANRTLPSWLLRRLEEVAAVHGGRVPLHGRLFAQWMHHAYPRECRYPHVSGTTNPMETRITADNFQSSAATEEEMLQYIDAVPTHGRQVTDFTSDAEAEGGCGMWSMEEELVAWRSPAAVPKPQGVVAALRGGALLCAIASALAATTVFSLRYPASHGYVDPWQKHYV